MSGFTLVLGNKNYSSWSVRAWLAAKQTGIGFDEIVVPLDRPETAEAIAKHSPSGRVPVLKHDGLVVWDSLAIVEYLAERYPEAGLWPADAAARAVARSVSAEMHASFPALRSQMPMNARASKPGRERTAEVESDIRRIMALWGDCRRRFGEGGPFLFGRSSAADAFFAPVVSRFKTYGVELDEVSRVYADVVLSWSFVVEWFVDAQAEPWTADRYDSL